LRHREIEDHRAHDCRAPGGRGSGRGSFRDTIFLRAKKESFRES
jgi:hypothetical protein